MKAMILAAGRGERMRHLTTNTPKPLLLVNNKALIEYRLESLYAGGIRECVINLAYRGEQIKKKLGNGQAYGLTIEYSDEQDNCLNTAGGIIKALPLLGPNPFLVMNADIWTDFNLHQLPSTLKHLAHLVLVNNPEHHINGDFALKDGMLNLHESNKLTFSGIGLYSPALFANEKPQAKPLLPILQNAIQHKCISGQYHTGVWQDIGTPERLQDLNQEITS